MRIVGTSLKPPDLHLPVVHFGEAEGAVVISSDSFVIARVPEGASSGYVIVKADGHCDQYLPEASQQVRQNLQQATLAMAGKREDASGL